jgi:hypothetical protein
LHDNLIWATEIRRARAKIKAHIKQSPTPWADVAGYVLQPSVELTDAKLWELLRAIPRVGETTIELLLDAAGITTDQRFVRISDLQPLQKQRLLSILHARSRKLDNHDAAQAA